MTVIAEQFVERMRAAKAAKDPAALRALIADDVTVHTPRFFKPVTSADHFLAIITGILHLLPDFEWHRVWPGDGEVLMEFRGHIQGGKTEAHGIELFELDEAGRIHTATIWMRPTSALLEIAEAEDAMVAQMMPAAEKKADG
jgi:hypothetical protein